VVAFKFYYSLPTIFSSYSNNLFKILQGAYDHVGKQLYLSLGLKVIESKSIKNMFFSSSIIRFPGFISLWYTLNRAN
jgi:hypothetical protein